MYPTQNCVNGSCVEEGMGGDAAAAAAENGAVGGLAAEEHETEALLQVGSIAQKRRLCVQHQVI
jgi:hypothetical protein